MSSVELGFEDLERFKDRFDMIGQGFEGPPALDFLSVGVFGKVFKDEGGVSEEDEVGLS